MLAAYSSGSNHCTLADRHPGCSTAVALRYRCKLISCGACCKYAFRPRVRNAQEVRNDWNLSQSAVTFLLDTIPLSQFNKKSIHVAYELFGKLASSLSHSNYVLGFQLKMELCQGRQCPDKSPSVLIHAHAEIATISPIGPALKSLCADCHFSGVEVQLVYDEGWTRYMSKPVIASAGENCSDEVLDKIRVELDAFQKASGVSRLWWFGGLYDGRKRRHAAVGAGVWKSVCDPSLYPGLMGMFKRPRLVKLARKILSVKKWGYLKTRFKRHYRVSLTTNGKLIKKRVASHDAAVHKVNIVKVKPSKT